MQNSFLTVLSNLKLNSCTTIEVQIPNKAILTHMAYQMYKIQYNTSKKLFSRCIHTLNIICTIDKPELLGHSLGISYTQFENHSGYQQKGHIHHP